MFGFRKNKENNIDLVITERENYISILIVLMELLNKSGNFSQSEFIHKLIKLINLNELRQFAKLINGIDMWGGAGAVWEVYIENKNQSKEFQKAIVNLIELMEKTKIIGSGIRPIKNIFIENLNRLEY